MGECCLETSGSLFLERQDSELMGNFSWLTTVLQFLESHPMSMAFRVMVIYQNLALKNSTFLKSVYVKNLCALKS